MALTPVEGQPGLFRDSDSGQMVNIRDYRESDIYDTVIIPAGVALPAGTEFVFFADVAGKRDIDSNFKTQRKLSAGMSMVLDRIGLQIRLALGNTIALPRDIKKVVENSYFRLSINTILMDEGPMVKFPSGYGLYGQTTETDAGIVSIGVPATASSSKLVKKQLLNQNHEIEGALRIDPRGWIGQSPFQVGTAPTVAQPQLEQPLAVTAWLHGLMRSAVTK